ncbi:hypothetical protein CDAR_534771 [Caerostris darwini]|uniref:Uncharacterized protein n=1 Tax=Caerostris darwini TaxID=1538125 RepID=A0AAV4U8P7_9ARAC|nr:hypothetical protein CDAR_534771 [Caerostris darwini]
MAAELIKLLGFEKAALTRIATFLTTVSSEISIISIKDRLFRCLQQIAIDAKKRLSSCFESNTREFLRTRSSVEYEYSRRNNLSLQASFFISKRGFELRKWRSNYSDVLRRLNVTKEEENFEMHGSTSCKVLGLQWKSSSDVFCFTSHLVINPPLTKRKIISNASQIFDPLGLIIPCVI